MCNAKKQPKPDWYNVYQRLVTLLDQMMATCAQTTYDAMKWKINPAEFIHVIRVHEGRQSPTTTLWSRPRSSPPSALEPVPETPAPTQLCWRRLSMWQHLTSSVQTGQAPRTGCESMASRNGSTEQRRSPKRSHKSSAMPRPGLASRCRKMDMWIRAPFCGPHDSGGSG